MTEQSTTQVNAFKDKLNTFVQPFKPLGQAIIVFAKTTTGKTIGIAVLAVIVVSVSVHLVHHERHEREYMRGMMMHQIDMDMNDPWSKFDEEMRDQQDQFEHMRERIENHRREMMQAMTMTDRDISEAMKQRNKTANQNITKLSINNNKQSGYSLSISSGTIQGTLIGNPSSKLSEQLQHLKGTLSGSMFSVPYTIENLQKVVEVLDEK